MILANGVGVGVFFYALENYLKELRVEQERDEYYQQVELRNVELQTVHQISQDIAANLDLDPILQTILGRVRQMIVYDRAEVCLYDKKDKVLRVRACMGTGDTEVDVPECAYRLGEGCAGWIGAHCETLFIPDTEAYKGQDPAVGQADGVPEPGSFLGVPLMVGQDIVGSVQVISGRAGSFDEHSRQLLETIAPHAAIAIQNAEQVMERERRLRAQIEKLRIEIDQVKRRRQVAEITDTEYFQELQKKSREMRADPTNGASE
jgi:transcriptional regulator with GAF, ATPase, and Fis domain